MQHLSFNIFAWHADSFLPSFLPYPSNSLISPPRKYNTAIEFLSWLNLPLHRALIHRTVAHAYLCDKRLSPRATILLIIIIFFIIIYFVRVAKRNKRVTKTSLPSQLQGCLIFRKSIAVFQKLTERWQLSIYYIFVLSMDSFLEIVIIRNRLLNYCP